MIDIYYTYFSYLDTRLIAYATDDGVIRLSLSEDKYNHEHEKFLLKHFGKNYRLINARNSYLDDLAQYLQHYFAGDFELCVLPQLKLYGSEFQLRVWTRLLELDVAETMSYGSLATDLQTAAQPVGNAVGANPIMIVVPCHRVLAKHDIGGFHFDLLYKKKLLNLEQVKF